MLQNRIAKSIFNYVDWQFSYIQIGSTCRYIFSLSGRAVLDSHRK